MVQVIQIGITKNDIPYVAQIIRIADEYDALVTERQYKTHINISKTLEDLIEDANPDEHLRSVALDHLSNISKLGKINKKVLKKLFKIVIEDTLYEISGISVYLDFLKSQVSRLEQIDTYNNKMISAKKIKEIDYYKEGMKMLFETGENFENYKQILEEYKNACSIRQEVIDKLYHEISIIKKLNVNRRRK